MQTNKNNLIVKLTFEFSLSIIEFTEVLADAKKFNLANQLFDSGTGIGSNVREAQNAESLADFIHKLKIAGKEADETEYWLLLCKYPKKYPDPGDLLEKIVSIQKILSKIISSTKTKIKLSNPQIIKLSNHQIR